MSGVRTFIAVELTGPVKAELARLQLALKRVPCPVKWVAPEGIHLTLCFLGELSSAQIDTVHGVMTQVSGCFGPFRLETSGPGAFPSLMQPQTLWVGLAGELTTLSELHRECEVKLHSIGYRLEGRPFRPHLTIARVQSEATPAARREMGEALSRLGMATIPVGVSQISLMKSTLNPTGAVYSCLYRRGLAGGGKLPA